ncbi:fibronectin type III domain-containing protein [Corynebacterium jeddahense]|uniref:Calcineurin-like phosphoesterase n=1 Tax=Corynebacterium jeddahense TaxID=1414719 RepID=A0ABY7UJK1_9CORY|nr:fibronectin type III domain-containing protein [Corynebacterium jeddahense]WCZ38777.1 Calcineurin-like phosphoesterase [Corynebacterium jeddahense]
MTLLRSPQNPPLRRGALATAVAITLLTSSATAVSANAQETINTRISRIVLGVGSDATEANLAWQSKRSGAQYVQYWPANDPDSVTEIESTPGPYNAAFFYPHQATMTGLQPETQYIYRVGNDRRGWSEKRTFTTGADSDTWNFLAMADVQIGVDTKIREQAAAWNKAVNVATGEHPESAFIMLLGDQIEGWGAPVAQLEAFTAPEKLQQYRLAVMKGNHETYAPDSHFRDTYFLPNEVGSSANYFFNYNNVLFIGLDGNRSSSEDINSHAKFVNDTIANSGAEADWVVVGIHQAPFSQGKHYTDSDVVRLRNELTPKLSEAGVDLVLSGHDHIYTRTHLMNGFNPVIPEGASKSGDVLIPEDGEVLYVTSTTATGGKYYDFQDKYGDTHPNIREERARDLAHDSTARWRQDYNPDYTNIEVSPTELKLTTYNINTPYVVDQVTLKKKDVPEETPTANPTTEQPTTEQPTTGQPTSGQPTSEQTSTAAEPTTEPSGSTVTATATETATATATETATATQTTTATQPPKTEVLTTTVTSEKLVTTTKTSVGTATVTQTSTQTTPVTQVVEQTKTVPTTVKETVVQTETVKVPTTITKAQATEVVTTTRTSVGSATVTETATLTSPVTKVVETTKTVPTTATETIVETKLVPTTLTGAADPKTQVVTTTLTSNGTTTVVEKTTTIKATDSSLSTVTKTVSQEPAPATTAKPSGQTDGDVEQTSSGSSASSIIAIVLGLLAALLAGIIAVIFDMYPQLVEDFRERYNI